MNETTKLPAHLEGLTIKRHKVLGRFVRVAIENVQEGDMLDYARFVARNEHVHEGVVNERTWEIALSSGNTYIESRGAQVRVWIDER